MTEVAKVQETPGAVVPPKQHAPGVYFGLDEQEYRNDPALGSTDLKRLSTNPADYWWESWMNPARDPDDDTPARKRGRAVHALVFYGEKEFDRRFIRIPHTRDMSPPDKGQLTKKYNALAAAKGKDAISSFAYDNIAIASAMIAKNRRLANALVGGLNEVSIFWRDTATGLRMKARIDCLKPRGVGDLKSIVNKFEKPFPKACLESIANYRYDIQARHYLHARAMLPLLVAEGCVAGDHDADLLKQIAASKTWAWQWVWWQAEGSPITYSRVLSPQNPMLEVAQAAIDRATANYRAYLEEFGTSMWVLEEEPTELHQEDMPAWYARD